MPDDRRFHASFLCDLLNPGLEGAGDDAEQCDHAEYTNNRQEHAAKTGALPSEKYPQHDQSQIACGTLDNKRDVDDCE